MDAREALFAKVASALNAQPDDLECVNGTVRVKGDPSRSLTWKAGLRQNRSAAGHVRGDKNPDRSQASGPHQQRRRRCRHGRRRSGHRDRHRESEEDGRGAGLRSDHRSEDSPRAVATARMIMGISYALFEEKVMDQPTGRMLNPNMEFYRLAGLNDIPELVVHMMTGKGYDERGVIGLGEPPVISPGAAISNAVANAIGVRVPFLPLTPDKVLAALEQKAGA